MKATLIYPFPLESGDAGTPQDARAVFTPFAKRFVETYLQHPPGGDHDLLVMFGGDAYEKADTDIFKDIQGARFGLYDGRGIDIGTAQFAVRHLFCNEFIIGCTSRVYFHRPGALQRLMEAREKYGRGLYGAVGSYERCPVEPERFPNAHLRTVFYGLDRDDFLRYPFTVTNRHEAHQFEAGATSLTNWFLNRGLPVKQVLFSGEQDVDEWRALRLTEIFRRGSQSDILVHDLHSDRWRDADPHWKTQAAIAAGDKIVRAM